MLQSIVHFSLRFRGIIVSLSCLVLAYGLFTASHASLDVLPNFVPPQATVQTEAPGLAPEQVELLVTRPIENAINGLGNQQSLRSETIQGLSVITIVFKDGTDVLAARQSVAEKLSQLSGQLPAGVMAPKISPLVSSTMDLLKIGLLSDKLSPMELRTFADWTLKPRLLSVSGVAKCSSFGGEVRQLQIQVHPELLLAHGVTIADVLNAARSSSGVRGAGFIENQNQRLLINTEGQSVTAEAIREIVIVTSASGLSVRLGDVATVKDGAVPRFGDALIMGKPGVLMTMSSQYGANTMDATRELEAALDDLKPLLEKTGITLYGRLHRPASFIETSLKNIRHSLLIGAVLVAVVLFLFLGDFRTAFISLTAIPLSLLGAIIILDRAGVTLNTITLGGLAIAIGEVVDDAIIDVENIVRRLRENQALAKPKPIIPVILDASLEVRSAVVYATFIVALVFVPVLGLSGLQGSFFAPLAKAYILAIMVSLLVALTVTPALSLILFGRGLKHDRPPRVQNFLRGHYERILLWVERNPWPVIVPVGVICLLALSRLPFLGGEFLPDFREGHFVMAVSAAPGTSMEESLRLGKQISDALLTNSHIATVEQQLGRAEQGEDTWGPERSEFHIDLKKLSASDEAGVGDEIRSAMGKIRGVTYELGTFVTDRIGESISGETAPVVVNIFGEDLDVLDAKAAEVSKALALVQGAAQVTVKSPPGAPRMTVRLKPDHLTQLGLRPVEVLDTIGAAYQGSVATQVYRDNQVNDVAVILDPESRRDPQNIGSLLLNTNSGLKVPLRAIADIFVSSGRSSILHEGARRRQTVTCNPTRDVQSFETDARRVIAEKVQFPPGTYVVFSGASEAQSAAMRELLVNSAIAGVGIIMLLSVVLGNWRNLIVTLFNLPFALVGGVIAIYVQKLLGGTASLSMGALVGFVTLFGITTRNAIMLISHCEHLVDKEGMPWNIATATRGASERLVPILMTATVTALGLLPLAIGSGEAGREIEGPMAVVILGGLATSTVLNLLVLPTLALRFGRFGEAYRGTSAE